MASSPVDLRRMGDTTQLSWFSARGLDFHTPLSVSQWLWRVKPPRTPGAGDACQSRSCSQCMVPRSASPEELVSSDRFLDLSPDLLNQNFWGWGPAVSGLTSSTGDSDALKFENYWLRAVLQRRKLWALSCWSSMNRWFNCPIGLAYMLNAS